ncbi:hypothetical protein OGAPHI_000106 [Ogataea philodendri]|uniref:Uncharacterized protein n=1 Tax=Ogataea philodendri TaxID=1378263 RepID=A0A9P8PI32_9ASCO|nr:uncharacterized protein OGAPHI_000106 [Ogataea philodendri]KAH3671920.1 hypothetical protein OGAPHI_000106 [Ogataea philodendri]
MAVKSAHHTSTGKFPDIHVSVVGSTDNVLFAVQFLHDLAASNLERKSHNLTAPSSEQVTNVSLDEFERSFMHDLWWNVLTLRFLTMSNILAVESADATNKWFSLVCDHLILVIADLVIFVTLNSNWSSSLISWGDSGTLHMHRLRSTPPDASKDPSSLNLFDNIGPLWPVNRSTKGSVLPWCTTRDIYLGTEKKMVYI